MKTLLLVTSVFLASPLVSVTAAPGDLDLTFNGTGIATCDFGFGDDIGNSVAVTPDNRIVIGGQVRIDTTNRFGLARLAENGALDGSFGVGGRVNTSVTTAGGNLTTIALLPGGEIVGSGYANYGTTSSNDYLAIRYTEAGGVDTTFGEDGRVRTRFRSSSRNDRAQSMALSVNGTIIVAGTSADSTSAAAARDNFDIALARYDTAGVPDGSFNFDGELLIPDDSGVSVAVQPDGRMIVLTGRNTLRRLLVDGTPDVSFGTSGRVSFANGQDIESDSLVIQPDGKILVVAHAFINNFDLALKRFHPDGTPDLDFNGTGEVIIDISGADDYATGAVVQSDGRIVLAGTAAGMFAVVRYNPDGSLDTSFGGTGIVTTAIGSGATATSIALAPDGKIVVGGYASNGANQDFAVARYEATLSDPEIVVEQPEFNGLSNGSTVNFGVVLAGASSARSFIIRNVGGADLYGLSVSFEGAGADEFTVNPAPAPPLPGPNGSTAFTVQFAPVAAATRTVALRIASDDSDESMFDVLLTARALAPDGDDDADGLTNQEEVNLAAFGFDPVADSGSLLTQFRDNGLFRTADVEALAIGTPVIQKDSSTGRFHLTLGLEKTADLENWTPLLGFNATYDQPSGRIFLDFPPTNPNAQFYRIYGARP